jgi:hypothetical protein
MPAVPSYKTIKNMQKNNPVLLETFRAIVNIYDMARQRTPKTGYFGTVACNFKLDGYEYLLSIRVTDDDMLHSFERRKVRKKTFEPVGLRSLKALLNKL